MEHIKIQNRDAYEEMKLQEMPLVNYSKEGIDTNEATESKEINTYDYNSAYDLGDTQQKTKADSRPKMINQKLSYIWVEAFFCAIILLGILIIQNVKNTERLQLNIREQIRHDLTAQELIEFGSNLEDTMQKYKNVTP